MIWQENCFRLFTPESNKPETDLDESLLNLQLMNKRTGKTSGAQLRRLIGISCLCSLILVPVSFPNLIAKKADSSLSTDVTTEDVRCGRFIRKIPAEGEVRTWQPIVIYNDCRAPEREIIELVPEGTWVEKGDVVCVLDASELEDKLREQEIELTKAKARLADALTRESLQDSENARLLAASELQASVARGRLEAYEQAESVNLFEKLAGDVSLMDQDLERAREDVERSRMLTVMGYQSLAGLANADAAFQRSERTVELARGELSMTKRFTHPRSLIELDSEATNAAQEVRRTLLQNSLAMSVSQITTLNMRQWEAGVQTHLAYLRRAVKACTMRAPKAGEIVYCHKRREGLVIEVGKRVYYTQNIVRIADRSRLVVAGRVDHAHVYSVKQGHPVEIRFSTLPDQMFHGELTWVAPIPTAAEWWQPVDLHHKVQIAFTDDKETLKSLTLSSSVDADIIVDNRPDVVQAPMNSVFSLSGEMAVIIREQDRLVVHTVQVGAKNEDYVEITVGLAGGEKVVVDERAYLRQLAKKIRTAEKDNRR